MQQIKAGGVGIIPTDTVYGLVCAANNEQACKRLYALKDRDTKPGTIIASSIDQIVSLGIKRSYLRGAEEFWPHSISVVVPCESNLSYVHLGQNSLAVRVPKSAEFRSFLDKSGPLLSTSANMPGEPTALTVGEAQQIFKDTVDFYVDGGSLDGRNPSTVLRIVDDAVEVLRQGAVTIDEAGRIIKEED